MARVLYLDTSALVKQYVEEAQSEQVREWMASADAAATSIASYPEARAALAAARRDGRINARGLARAVADLDQDWRDLAVYNLGEELARAAGELAQRHRLRGYDSVHLATFLHVCQLSPSMDVRFGCFDAPLVRAAALARRRLA